MIHYCYSSISLHLNYHIKHMKFKIPFLKKPNSPLHFYATFIFILISFQNWSCNSGNSFKPEKNIKDSGEPELVFRINKGILGSSLQIPGELVAYQKVDLFAKENSYVKHVYVDVGSEVKTGQLLVTLEAPEFSAQLANAESKFKSQQALFLASSSSFKRLLETSKTPGTVSKNDIDQAFAKKNSDSAQYQAAKSAYSEIVDLQKYLEIRAPFTGVISIRNINPGAYVGPGGKGDSPLFSLEQQDKLRLVISVPEENSGQLNYNTFVSFNVQSLPGSIFHAKVQRMAGSLDNRLRAERVEMDIDNKNKQLLPGMYAEVKLPLKSVKTAFIIPKSAFISSTEGNFVIRINRGKYQRVPVSKETDKDSLMQIFGSLTVGDTLVKAASDEMHNGMKPGKIQLVKFYNSDSSQ